MSTTSLATLLLWVASRLVVYEPALSKTNVPTTKSQQSKKAKGDTLVVAIDPGHGGSARGACSPITGVCEKTLLLHLALEAKKVLGEMPGVRVFLTRHLDSHISLYDRSEIAHKRGADLFLSLHANASPKGDQQGFEVFVYPPSSLHGGSVTSLPQSPESPDFKDWHVRFLLGDLHGQAMRQCSVAYGEILLDEMAKHLEGRPNRGLKQKGLAVLSGLKIPGVLVEIGFLDHPYEGKLLLEQSFQSKVLDALKSSLLAWMKRNKNDGCRHPHRHHPPQKLPVSKEDDLPPPTLRQQRRKKKLLKSLRRHNVGTHAPWHLSPKEKSGLLVLST